MGIMTPENKFDGPDGNGHPAITGANPEELPVAKLYTLKVSETAKSRKLMRR